MSENDTHIIVDRGMRIKIAKIVFIMTTVFLLLPDFIQSKIKFEYNIHVAIFLILAIVYTLFDIFVDIARTRKEVIFKWENAIPCIIEQISTSRDIKIIAASTESYYQNLKSAIRERKNLKIKILMRALKIDDECRREKIKNCIARWHKLADESSSEISIRFSDNKTLRGIIIDENYGFGGFYKYEIGKFYGDRIPAFEMNREPGISSHLLSIYLNQFNCLWDCAIEDIDQIYGTTPAGSLQEKGADENIPLSGGGQGRKRM